MAAIEDRAGAGDFATDFRAGAFGGALRGVVTAVDVVLPPPTGGCAATSWDAMAKSTPKPNRLVKISRFGSTLLLVCLLRYRATDL